MESVLLTTADGVELDADLVVADGDPVGGVVVCHPHPQFGGDRFNPVVDALFRHLPGVGFTTLRFDFRREFDGGVAERHDVVAALDELEARGIGTTFATGYSFGAAVALNRTDDRIRGVVAVAPPLAMMEVARPGVPTFVLTPAHDQFSPPAVTEPVVARWPDNEFRVVESADHFLVGRARAVAEAAATWLVARM